MCFWILIVLLLRRDPRENSNVRGLDMGRVEKMAETFENFPLKAATSSSPASKTSGKFDSYLEKYTNHSEDWKILFLKNKNK